MTSTQFNIVVRGAGSLTFDLPEDEVWLQDEHHKVIWTGNPAELIELILLGKASKAQLPVCGLCGKPAVASFSPHPDCVHNAYKAQLQAQIKLCDLCGKPTTGQNPHYDCAQREAYLASDIKQANKTSNLKELQNNG